MELEMIKSKIIKNKNGKYTTIERCTMISDGIQQWSLRLIPSVIIRYEYGIINVELCFLFWLLAITFNIDLGDL
jgi:hypothetical protein